MNSLEHARPFNEAETDGSRRKLLYSALLTTLPYLFKVASFGDYFADKRSARGVITSKVALLEPSIGDKTEKAIHATTTARELNSSETTLKEGEVAINTVIAEKKHGRRPAAADGPVECLTYRDPFSYVYKK